MAWHRRNELIWQGRVHLGDEPGIYADAHYCGLNIDLPFTVFRTDPDDREKRTFELILETEDMVTYPHYPGHQVSITAYEPDQKDPYRSVERVVVQTKMSSDDNNQKVIEVEVGEGCDPYYFSIDIRVDTTVNPGLYDDFVVKRLSLKSEKFALHASFGFQLP